ncbi:MAG: hypothetical protein AAF495_05335 [Pseudomonadota bacterium]
MPKIVVTIQVEDLSKWEQGFKTHGALFRRQTIKGQYDYTMIHGENRVVLCAEVEDVDEFFEELETPQADDAKDLDGVKRESIRFYVLDRRFTF